MIHKGTRVVITSVCNTSGQEGIVINNFKAGYCLGLDYVTVQLDNGVKRGYNQRSVKIIQDKESNKMEGYNRVAVVNLLDDYNKKDYGFALFDDDAEHTYVNGLVVVNSRGKDNRVLGIVKEILTKEEYRRGVTAEVIGVVNTFNYDQREAEKQRKIEIKKKKEQIFKELDTRINKIKDMEFYEKRAEELADIDPELKNLVAQLKTLVD